jgi:hypothetical protein
LEEEDILIPPVPQYRERQKRLEEGFLKTEEELPAFEEHELKSSEEETSISRSQSLEKTKTTQVKTKKEETEYAELPDDVVHRAIRRTCFVALILWLVIIILFAFYFDTFKTLIGFSPVILTIIVTYILVDKYHLESGFLMVFPFVFTAIFMILAMSFYENEMPGYLAISTINIVFGLLFEAAIIIHYSLLKRRRKIKREEKEVKKEEIKEVVKEEVKQEEITHEEKVEEKKLMIRLDDDESLKTFVSSIEDKSKAINAAIGRVYSVKHGGTEPLRKKIKIDAEHYNEISELEKKDPADRKQIAIRLLQKINERLELLQLPEREVFDNEDMADLINLERERTGKDAVIDVLMRNDKDPVGVYYQGALEFCQEALKELEA